MRRTAIKALVAAAALAACAAIPAAAQEVISTAAGAPGDGAPPVADAPPLRLSDRTDQGPDILRPLGPCGGPALNKDGKPDRTPHGEVWAGVGTHGYREVGGAVCAPIGDKGAVSIAVDAGHMDGWGRRR